jgi:predicted porin
VHEDFAVRRWRLTRVSVALAAVALWSAAAVGADELDVYGRVNVTVQNADEAGEEEFGVRNNASRVGVKGEKTLTPRLKAIYQLEFGVNLDGDSGDDVFTHRNQFVGLEGAFGTIKVGRHDTALKKSQGTFDLFDDLEGDINRVFNGENRLTRYIGYTSPTFGQAFSATANFFPGRDGGTGEDEEPDRTSFSVGYETDLAYAALAHDRDVDGEGVETTRLVAGHSLGAARIMLLYQRTDAGAIDEDGIGASVSWKFGGNTVKFQYLAAQIWRADPQDDPADNLLENMVSAGFDREFGEDTKVFAFYSSGDIGGSSESVRYVAVGIQHNF